MKPGSSRSPLLLSLALVAAASTVTFALWFIGRSGSAPEATVQTLDRLNSGERPPFPGLEVRTSDGQAKWSIERSLGRVVLVSFWATWCAPCRHELPAFRQLQKDYGDRGFEVVTIHVDSDADSIAEASRMWSELQLQFTPFVDFDRLLTRSLDVKSLPTNLLVDRRGRVVLASVGEMDWLSSENRSLILEALNEAI